MMISTPSVYTLAAALCLTSFTAFAQSGKTPVDLTARLAQSQTDASLATELMSKGRRAAAVCANCHGAGGNSTKPDIPNLAGQNPAYLLDQMRLFADGKRRFEFMEGMIKAMSADEKVGAVLFYAAQPVITSPAKNAALADKGKAYYDKVCFRCHANDGHGNNTFARIAGQQSVYLTTTLKNYRDAKGGRTNPLMADNTRHMSDADIEAVVTYVSSMK